MTVNQLRKELQLYPDNMEVRMEDWNESYHDPWPVNNVGKGKHHPGYIAKKDVWIGPYVVLRG